MTPVASAGRTVVIAYNEDGPHGGPYEHESVKRIKKKHRRRSADEGSYTCPTCGETIVIPLDRSAGDEQTYGEDCPVCCNPNLIHVEFFADDTPARVWAESE